MLKKLSLALLVSASLSCFGQVSTVGGTATTAGPGVAVVPVSAANAPLISTPDIALPGSGSAVGAPLSSAGANDSRSSNGPSVFNPNATGYVGSEANAAAAPAANVTGQPAGASSAASASQPFENGIQHFQSGLPNAGNATMSLAQIARSYRAQHHQTARSFNNDSIAQMNAAGVRTGNLGPETSTVAAAQTPAAAPAQNGQGTLMAENQPPALPQSDQAQSAPAAQSAPQPSSTASQQRHAQAEPASSAPSTTEAAQAPPAPETEQSAGNAKLPQTASYLPLLLLLGGIGVAGGAVYWLRK